MSADGTAYPVVIATWDRNNRGEVIRLALDHYHGNPTVDLRVWYSAAGQIKPTKAGLTLGVKHLAALAEATAKALERARELGLVDDGGAK